MQPLSETRIRCPYCGETIEVLIDPQDVGQQYIEDCQVCCQPWSVRVNIDMDGVPHVHVAALDE